MPRIRFLQTRVVGDYRKGTSEEERYEAGKSYSLSEASCNRWVSRGVAEHVAEGKSDALVSVTATAAASPAQPERQARKTGRDKSQG